MIDSPRLVWGWLLAALLVAGCIFQPREANPPEKPVVGPPWVEPQAMYDGLTNMEKSIEARVLTNYQNSFREGEIDMRLSDEDAGELGADPFPGWTRDAERQRMLSVLDSAPNASVSLSWAFTPDQPDSIQEGNLWHYRDLSYRLVFKAGSDSVAYTGLVDLYFLEEEGTYLITRWLDKVDGSSNHTWGWLRYQGIVQWPEGD